MNKNNTIKQKSIPPAFKHKLFSKAPIQAFLFLFISLLSPLNFAETFDPGAFIIDMGQEPQTIENAIKPYGLVYDLIENGHVPVYWSISPNKTKDGDDFIYNGTSFKGGSFIVPAKFAKEAKTYLNKWKAKNVVITGPTTVSFDAPVYGIIGNFPKSVLDTENGKIIAAAFYKKAEIPTSYYRIGTPNDINSCDDIFALPHADPENWDAATIKNFSDYVYGGGYLWAGCRAASGIENSTTGSTKGLGLYFLSKNGLVDHTVHGDQSGSSPVLSPTTATHPIMQLLGGLGMIGGSEEVYIPEAAGWRATTTLAAIDPDQPETTSGNAGLVTYGFAKGNPNYGMVVYEASHDIGKKATDAEIVAAARIYGNFLLMSGIDKKVEVTASTLPPVIVKGVTNSYSVTAPTATSYQWSSNCSGQFSPNASSADVDFTLAPSTVDASLCVVKVIVSDNCGRSTLLTSVTPPPIVDPPTSLPFSCSSEMYVNYVTSGNYANGIEKLTRINLLDGTTLDNKTVQGVIGVTSLGYNVIDNYLWGYNMGNKEIVRIDADYNTTSYGLLGLDDELYSGADVSSDGILHLSVNQNNFNIAANKTKIARVDLNGVTPVKLPPLILDTAIDAYDIAFNPVNNNLYFISQNGNFYKITITNNGTKGIVSIVDSTGLGNVYTVVSGFDRAGNFYFNKTGGGKTEIWKIKFGAAGIIKVNLYKTLADSLSQGDGAMCANAVIAPPPPPPKPEVINKCFAMTDNKAQLYKFDLDINTPPVIVNMAQILNGEAAVYRASNNSLYTFNQDLAKQDEEKPSDLYKVDMNGGITLIKKAFLPKKANGAEFVRYIDGSEHLITLQNKNKSTISIFDATDLANANPLKTLTLVLPGGGFAHVDGLAVNPNTGEILVSDDDDYSTTDHSEIYSVNMDTGVLTLVTSLNIQGIDAESLAFADDGHLYTENETRGVDSQYHHKIYRVNLSTGAITAVEDIKNLSGDIEGMSCTGSKVITTKLPSFTKKATPNKTEAGKTVSFTYEVNNELGLDITLDFLDDLTVVNDFTGTAVDEGSAPVNGTYIPGTLSIINATGTHVFSNNNKTLTITTLSIPAKTSAMIQVDMRVPSSHSEGDYFTQAVLSNLIYIDKSTGNSIPNNHSSVYSDDPTRPLFPDPTQLTLTPSTNKVCTALSGSINAGLSPVSSLKNADKIFLGSTDITSQLGHLKAFAVDASGTPAATAIWDAAAKMDSAKRAARFYSSKNSSKTKLSGSGSALTATDFGVADSATVTSAIYSASLGSLSPGSNLALITNEMDTLSYLNDVNYRSYFTSRIASRTKRVLASSDDGFLYAFNQSNGELGWAWTPSSLLSELQNTSTFKGNHFMQGDIEVLDIKDSTNSYRSYVVGSYRQGLGHYVLRLSNDTDSDLDAVVWDQDVSASMSMSPNMGKPSYFKDASGTAYMAYVASDPNSSMLYIKSITNDTAADLAIPLNFDSGFKATSTPYIMPAMNGSHGRVIFLGDEKGNIYSTPLLNNNGALNTTSTIATGLEAAVSALSLNTTDTDPVLFIGGARSSKNNGFYLRAQSATQLTVFKYTNSSWERQWSSSWSSATRWKKTNGKMVVDTADKSVVSIPTGAMITDNAYIVADSIVLPVMHLRSGNNCEGDSYYYFYNLTDGHFPTQTFYNGSAEITNELELGMGKTRALHLTNLLSSDNMLGLGMSDQTTSGGSGISASITIKDPFTTGIRSWRELRH